MFKFEKKSLKANKTYSHQVTQTDGQTDEQRRRHAWQRDADCRQDNKYQLEGRQCLQGDRLVEVDPGGNLKRK